MSNSLLSKIRWPRRFAGLRGITMADVPREVSAGVTLAALIPLNIGYAQVAGLPPGPASRPAPRTGQPRNN
jgi:MFS superfamily sulfate permease-like transporter